jgi:hypothetical protein
MRNALPRIRLDGGLSLCMPRLTSRSVLIGIVEQKVSVVQGLLRVLQCFPEIIIAGVLRDVHSPAPYSLSN